MKTIWTIDMITTLCRDYADTPTEQLAERLGVSVAKVYAKAAHLGLKKSADYLASPHACRLRRGDSAGASTRFKKGQAPRNKGMKGLDIGGKATRFKKGQTPHNTHPIGSYRITKDGNLQRKISNATGNNSQRWRCVHELIWIEAHGKVPDGHIIVFKKSMHTSTLEEITLDKIECVSLAENMRRNSYRTNYPKEVAQLVQLRGAITRQINKRSKA